VQPGPHRLSVRSAVAWHLAWEVEVAGLGGRLEDRIDACIARQVKDAAQSALDRILLRPAEQANRLEGLRDLSLAELFPFDIEVAQPRRSKNWTSSELGTILRTVAEEN
jgi:hypothetical protein